MNKKFKRGILNPLITKNAHFDYEVIEDNDDVKLNEYEDNGRLCTYPEKQIVIRSLNGGSDLSFGNEFVLTVYGNDAYKHLRVGELISINLKFRITKQDDGSYVQYVTGDELFTINDYHQIRESEAEYQGETSKSKEEMKLQQERRKKE